MHFLKLGHLDYRTIFVENNVFPHVNGSSRVKIADRTDIICSVKVKQLCKSYIGK